MPRSDTIEVLFPIAGLDRSTAYQTQAPYTTPDCLNVRAQDPREQRRRGGSRPGLVRNFSTVSEGGAVAGLGTPSPIRMLAAVRDLSGSADQSRVLQDSFGSSLIAPWTAATFTLDDGVNSFDPFTLTGFPVVSGGKARTAATETSAESAKGAYQTLPVNNRTTRRLILNTDSADGTDQAGEWWLFADLADASPGFNVGIFVQAIRIESSNDNNLQLFVNGTNVFVGFNNETNSRYDTLILQIESQNIIKVFWDGAVPSGIPKISYVATSYAPDPAAHQTYGFALHEKASRPIVASRDFRFEYAETVSSGVTPPPVAVVASSAGRLYVETEANDLQPVTDPFGATPTDLAISTTDLILAQERSRKLYIADFGTRQQRLTAHADAKIAFATDLLTDTAVGNWTDLGTDADDEIDKEGDLVEVISFTGGTNGVVGRYKITTVAAGGLTLDGWPATSDTTTLAYRVIKGMKIYDGGALTLWEASANKGTVPMGCTMIQLYKDRFVLAGDPEASAVWYMSRKNNPLDWLYGTTDPNGAIAATNADQGLLGQPITAIIAYGDDYLLFGCQSEIWRLRGDPAFGGSVDNISRMVGVVDRTAYCFTPEGDLIFMAQSGLYILRAGSASYPEALSEQRLPLELFGLSSSLHWVQLAYNVRYQSVEIYATSKTTGASVRYWFDWRARSFWPMSMSDDHDPTALLAYSNIKGINQVLLGGRDGFIRRFDDSATNDDGTSFDTHCYLGPFRLGSDEGILRRLVGRLDQQSDSVTWSVHVGDTAEQALQAVSSESGTWSSGRNYDDYPRSRGSYAFVKLAGATDARWSFESFDLERMNAGRNRRN